MYFISRAQAGDLLADKLEKKYRYENCAVVALNDGGVIVGAQIAIRLHCVLTMLLTTELQLPREYTAIASVNQGGGVTYNPIFSEGELDEIQSEYRNVIEEEKITKMHELNRLLGDGGLIREDLLRGRNIIVVSDGLSDALLLDSVADFLKPIKTDKLIVATPLASVPAVDRMHMLADEIYCLDVLENYIDTQHYYDLNDVPDHQATIKIIQDVVLQWK